ncbi:MAG: FtsX-like permease family protein [Dehalococcoidia bacterium]
MTEFFFVPMNLIALVALIAFAVVMGWLLSVALRNRIIFKLGVRNPRRRPAQTALIVFGLMLSTLVITSALGVGDTLAYTLKSMAVRDLGHTDEGISAATLNDDGKLTTPRFDYSRFERLRAQLEGYNKIDGLAPAITGRSLVVNLTARQNEPGIQLFAPDPDHLSGFGLMKNQQGQSVSLSDLGPDEVYLDRRAADRLDAHPGDDLLLSTVGNSLAVRLKSIVKGTSAGANSVVLMPLSRAQEFLQWGDQINAIYVSNKGGPLEGVEHSDEVTARLEDLLAGTGLEVDTIKQDRLRSAGLAGNAIATIFAFLGVFSIAAGVLLIFLIFAMLSAARKPEIGMARAVGMKRRQLVHMFLFEGTAYDLCAALVGVLLGMAVSVATASIIVGVLASAWPDIAFDLVYHFETSSMILAFVVGTLVTFITISLSSWKLSQLNIVRAIRDIPEPPLTRVGYQRPLVAISLLVLGLLLLLASLAIERASLLYLGFSLGITSVALLLRWLGLRERLVFSLAGIALVIWSLFFVSSLESVLGDMSLGIEVFFFSGLMMVLGSVWIVVYNLNLLLLVFAAVLGRIRGIVPALTTAVAHASSSRLGTGLTIAMFALVVFILTFMSVTIGASAPLFEDADLPSGGYDIVGIVPTSRPIEDISSVMGNATVLNTRDILAVGSLSTLSSLTSFHRVRQSGVASTKWKKYPVLGADDVFLDTNTFEFTTTAQGYESAADVWLAIRENPGYAVITADAVPSRSLSSMSRADSALLLEGPYRDDEVMSPVELDLQGGNMTLTIIGVIEPMNLNRGIYTSQNTLEQGLSLPVIPTTYLFKVADGVDAEATAHAIESEFFAYGMEARSIDEILEEESEIYFAISSLLQGFVALGLVVGIAALGVISVRAVIERRHEIGVLRAIGFKQRTVQLSFLLESSIVALLGIFIGVVLALLLSYQVVEFMKTEAEGLEFHIPWAQTLATAAAVWGASLLMTYLPSREASKIDPAEALRYE